jgi:hypothetical protein
VLSPSGPRQGQARDAARAVAQLPIGQARLPLVVWNIDTVVRPPAPVPQTGNWLQVSRKRGVAWSFAQLAHGFTSDVRDVPVVRTAEKMRISPWASTGLYGFASGVEFSALVDAHAADTGELYVAPLFNEVLAAGSVVTACEVPARSVTVMGTPEQFKAGCRARSWSLPAELL